MNIDSNIALLEARDYYIAVRFDAADTSTAGATFYVKNLETGNEVTASIAHTAASLHNSTANFVIGNRGDLVRGWDGLISELTVRRPLPRRFAVDLGLGWYHFESHAGYAFGHAAVIWSTPRFDWRLGWYGGDDAARAQFGDRADGRLVASATFKMR